MKYFAHDIDIIVAPDLGPLLDDHSIKCWGRGYEGQLGNGSPHEIGDSPGEMGENLPRVDLGKGRTAVTIATGRYYSCAVLDNASLKCWGDGANGELGNGLATPWLYIGDDPGEMGDQLLPVDLGAKHTATQVIAGQQSTCVVLEDRVSVKCWGNGYDGELGNSMKTIVGDEPGEMGDHLDLVPIE